MKKWVWAFTLCVAMAEVVRAGSSGSSALFTPQGSGGGTDFGDYVSDAGALNTTYRYFVEVPPGLTRLRIQIFDADIGLGGANEDTAGRDRDRNGYATSVTYSLLNPSSQARTTLFNSGTTTLPAASDNAWVSLYDSTGDTYRDNFGTAAYTNNDGTANWASNWAETNDNAAAGSGNIQITGGLLRVRDDGNAANSMIEREVNLSGASGAILTFDLTTSNLEATDQFAVDVSSNGGGAWTTLQTFTGNQAAATKTYDISAYVASNTRIRFRTVGTGISGTDQFTVDNVQIRETTIEAGHWEVDINMSSAVTTDDDINAFGIRADDGDATSAGTELNVYADSIVPIGSNPPASGTLSRTYTLYPYVTSGCTCAQNDFDYDSNSGGATGVGSVTYTSRSNAFTQSVASAALSANNVWKRNTISGWTSDTTADDYGIWTAAPTISSYLVAGQPNGNYGVMYASNYVGTANPPAANPVTNAFRIYMPNDAGAAPAKPYVAQFLTQRFNGALSVGTASRYTVTVRVTNPSSQAITFSSPTNIVTTNVPGSGVVYGGNAQVSQGSILSAPAVGGTGNVTWNAGTLAAGGEAILSYDVTVTATSAGQRLPITATPASGNGTRAKWVDETGNTTQTRAAYTFGPICELAATEGLLTEVLVSSFDATTRGGRTLVEWKTSSEAGTVGFNLYRVERGSGTLTQVNKKLLPANVGTAAGGRYRYIDAGSADAQPSYVLEELTASGRKNRYGPFVASGTAISTDAAPIDFDRLPKKVAGAKPGKRLGASPHGKASAVMAGFASTGIARVSASDLAAQLGSNVQVVVNAIRKGGVSVTNRGAQVAWTPAADGNAILFYAQAADSIFSTERVYRIALDRGVTMNVVDVAPSSAPLTTFASSIDLETDAFPATVLPLDPDSDYWFWDYVIAGYPPDDVKPFNVNIPAVASADNVTLQVRLQGAMSGIQHHARVVMNGVPVGEATWKDLGGTTVELPVPAAVLRDGANQLEVSGLLDDGASFDVFYVDGFTVKYNRAARPENGQLRLATTTGSDVNAGPFAGAPTVLDVANPLRPSLVHGGASSGGNVAFVAPSAALFLADTFVAPSSLRASVEATLRGSNRADYVVIAPSSLRASADALAQLRQRDGLTAMAVDLEQIYDEFAGGNATPYAIRDFIAATRSWQTKPRYFVLAGGGNLDYRGITDDAGLVPPLMTKTTDGLYAADSRFGDLDGDGLPEVAIGRIPVASAAELDAYVRKLDASARATANGRSIVFSADAQDRGADFRRASQQVETPMSALPATRIYVDEVGGDAARASMLDAWHSGAPLVSWVGHGGLDRISSASLVTNDDAATLTTNGGPLPLLLAMTCTINRFELGPSLDALGAALTRAPNAGAIAVWSASGLSLYGDAAQIEQSFLQLAAKQPQARVGDLVVASLAANRSLASTGSVYLLLGDPAARLNLPAPLPPTGRTPRLGE